MFPEAGGHDGGVVAMEVLAEVGIGVEGKLEENRPRVAIRVVKGQDANLRVQGTGGGDALVLLLTAAQMRQG
ncbi:MAG: hypothetical protein ACYTGH_22295 [Planctomycetota bacterium]|jgi:hypothetical protein